MPNLVKLTRFHPEKPIYINPTKVTSVYVTVINSEKPPLDKGMNRSLQDGVVIHMVDDVSYYVAEDLETTIKILNQS